MGCAASKQSCLAENRPQELVECTAMSPDVRWSWLRRRTLFTFGELRSLLKLYQGAIVTVSVASGTRNRSDLLERKNQEFSPAKTGASDVTVVDSPGLAVGGETGAAPSFTTRVTRGSSLSSLLSRASSPEAVGLMSKEQFLAACDTDELFGLPEVVGTFGSRLFDVLDGNGDGKLTFEDFAEGMSTLLKGPESEKLKLMYAAYDVSGVKSSEERSSSAASGIGGGGSKSWKSIPSRRSKFLTVEDITAALATASQDVYPTLFQFSAGGSDLFSTPSACLGGSSSSSGESYHGGDCRHDAEVNKRRSNSGRGGMNGRRNSLGGIGGEEKSETSTDRAGGQGNESKTRDTRVGGSVGRDGVRAGNDREAVEEALKALARRNAANFAERAVSEFGQAQNGALTRKEFEKWALTGPVLRCRINEFSLDVNVVPFQGVRLA